jgi:hypothetical protein
MNILGGCQQKFALEMPLAAPRPAGHRAKDSSVPFIFPI